MVTPPVLTHFDGQGQAHMVDVAGKAATHRVAIAQGRIVMNPATLSIILQGSAKKGDVLGIARVAGIMAAKKTSELTSLCHPLALTRVAIDFLPQESDSSVGCRATVETVGLTGGGNGGAHRGAGGTVDNLRHVQGGRPRHDHHRRETAREARR